ncbi:FecCD family ABC transporter permease [Vibrio splendidus]|uniref:FecCD family ABC transporter permease n=1 Tax=Vibrio splendidus TaxID=29497 RepID=UPI0022361D0B|nr:iron chelate uptake ABC transporter family permease subunit [Vibrio splendidus]MCW4438911.1 iron chelate uptake ABC transporter family permease subunit [Vibrio splendidus]
MRTTAVPTLIWLSLIAFLLLGSLYSLLSWSSFPLTSTHLIGYLFAFDSMSIEHQILASIRVPRLLSGLIIGANLAIAGALMQGLTRNPLASPSVLGINAGAACFMALSTIGVPLLSEVPSVVVASIGGVVSGALVMTLGGFFSARPHPLKLVLAGIAISALLTGVTRASVILADDKAYSVINWLAGSLSSMGWEQWHKLWPVSIVGVLISMYVAKFLNLLALGNDVATSLGLNITLTRFLTCIAVVLLTASCVAVAGSIGFVGMLVPHIAKRLVGTNFHILLPACALLGAGLIAWSDALSRAIAFPAETPVGVITALIGTPFFIFLAVRGKS